MINCGIGWTVKFIVTFAKCFREGDFDYLQTNFMRTPKKFLNPPPHNVSDTHNNHFFMFRAQHSFIAITKRYFKQRKWKGNMESKKKVFKRRGITYRNISLHGISLTMCFGNINIFNILTARQRQQWHWTNWWKIKYTWW